MNENWDDLRLFLAVSRLGGLSAARESTGLSAATLGRRITALERRVGIPLFVRRQTGYGLTATGQDLFDQAEEVERAMLGLARWSEGASRQRAIRLSAGNWTTDFLARHITRLWQSGEPFIEFVTANTRIDIGHRAADIGVRNARPTDPHLAGRRVGKVAFAMFGTPRQSIDAPVIGLTGDTSATPSARWMAARFATEIGLRGNGVFAVRELVTQGVGQSVLPCFIGDADPCLCRMGPVIPELTTEQWLVAHHDERHDSAIRRVLERIAGLLGEAAALFAGETPTEFHPEASRT